MLPEILQRAGAVCGVVSEAARPNFENYPTSALVLYIHIQRIRNTMPIKLEEKDIKILRCIDEDGSCNLDEISKRTSISRSTVHYRLKKFEKMGLIRGTFVELDPQILGLDITAVTFVNVSYENTTAEEIGEKLASISGVFTVYYVLGDFDFIVISKAKDREDLKRILREIHAIDGVVKTGTHFVASTIKEEKRLLVNYDDEVLKKLFCE